MIKRALGKTGFMISPVMFGGIINMSETPQDAVDYVAYAVEQGINYFDVAPSYGNAEERLGPALRPYRKDVYLACKTTERSAEGARKELLASLKMLETDHFDIYQMHAIATDEDVTQVFAPGGAMETFQWAQQEGLIRKIGFTTHNEDAALKMLDNYAFDTVLFPMNWAMGLNIGWGDRISAAAQEKNFGLLAMKTLIERKWREGEKREFPKSWCKPIWNEEALGIAAMKYGLSKGATALVPPGNIRHFRFMVEHIDACLENPLNEDELRMLKERAALVKDEMIF